MRQNRQEDILREYPEPFAQAYTSNMEGESSEKEGLRSSDGRVQDDESLRCISQDIGEEIAAGKNGVSDPCRSSSEVEHLHGKEGVTGSIPVGGSILFSHRLRPPLRRQTTGLTECIFECMQREEGALHAPRSDRNTEEVIDILG